MTTTKLNFSVGKLGGSDSRSIRPNEEQGSVEQYCGFESYSLRHLVWWGQRLRAGARARLEKTPRFRGVLGVALLRTRTGDQEFRSQPSAFASLFSAGEFGGSDSLFVRAKARVWVETNDAASDLRPTRRCR